MLQSRTKPYKRDYVAIVAKYPLDVPLAVVARLENVPISTLEFNVRRHKLRPRRGYTKEAHKRRMGEARKALRAVLDAVNTLRASDMTGPEVCAELTDIIIETMERI